MRFHKMYSMTNYPTSMFKFNILQSESACKWYLNQTRVREAQVSLGASEPAYGNNNNKASAEQAVSMKGCEGNTVKHTQ